MKKQLFGAFLLLGTLSITSCGGDFPPEVTKEEFLSKISTLPTFEVALNKYVNIKVKGSISLTINDEKRETIVNEEYLKTEEGWDLAPGVETTIGENVIDECWLKTFLDPLFSTDNYLYKCKFYASSTNFAAFISADAQEIQGMTGSSTAEYRWNEDGLILYCKSNFTGSHVDGVTVNAYEEFTFNWSK